MRNAPLRTFYQNVYVVDTLRILGQVVSLVVRNWRITSLVQRFVYAEDSFLFRYYPTLLLNLQSISFQIRFHSHSVVTLTSHHFLNRRCKSAPLQLRLVLEQAGLLRREPHLFLALFNRVQVPSQTILGLGLISVKFFQQFCPFHLSRFF